MTTAATAEEERYAEHVRQQQRVAAEAKEFFAGGMGHAPTLLKPRVGRPSVKAKNLAVGERVRVRFFEYDAQRDVNGFATIAKLVDDPGCPWNAAWPPTIHLLLDGPDGNRRCARPAPDREIELGER